MKINIKAKVFIAEICMALIFIASAITSIAAERSADKVLHDVKNENVLAVNITADCEKSQAVTSNGLIKIWQLESGKVIKVIKITNSSGLSAAKFSDDGKLISTCFVNEKECKILDTETGRQISFHNKKLSDISMLNSNRISTDRKFVLFGDANKLILEGIENKKINKVFTGHNRLISSVAISKDNKFAASGSYGTVKIWDIDNTREHVDLRILYPIDNKDSKNWVTYDEMIDADRKKGGAGSAQSGLLPILTVEFSPEGNMLSSGGLETILRLWDTISGRLLFTCPNVPIISATFSPDNKYLLTGGYDKSLILWEIEGLIKVREFISSKDMTGYNGVINSVSFSQNGKYILSGSDNGVVQLWDVATGKKIRRFK
jgi:WD40 repeat protein